MRYSMALDPNTVKEACLRAADILSGMGYIGPYGSIHLLNLKLQRNTLTAIFHNIVAWQISELDKNWDFKPRGGRTPDLVYRGREDQGIQLKCTSNGTIKGNRVSRNKGYFVLVKYSLCDFRVKVEEILMGELDSADWDRPEGTQFAILKGDAEAKLCRIYP